ncbi:MAG: tetratricopeptide repeat protein [Planctomycetes bacterium]|nr:tetratricopeptide repeat protein [Planctomycetota bacterium]
MSGKAAPGKRGSGPLVGYDLGPTRRVEPRPTGTKGSSGPTPKAPSASSLSPTHGKGVPQENGRPKGAKGSDQGGGDFGGKGHKGSREVLVPTRLSGHASGIATGAIGGVYAGGYRGGLCLDDDPWVRDPWGWGNRNRGNWFSSSWCWWSYPCYWSWYYPAWWYYSRSHDCSDYCCSESVSTVVYAEPQVIYVGGQGGIGTEPVGEAAVLAPPTEKGRLAPPAAEASPLSIAAQRYLELGDRAFREGRYSDAVQFYAKAVELAPDQGALHLVLSDALFAAGDYHYGAYAVRRALELDPALVESQIDKHAFYPDPKQFDEQLAALDRYLSDHPTDRDARLVLALNYLLSAQAKEAVRVLESASPKAEEDAAQRILTRARQLAQF